MLVSVASANGDQSLHATGTATTGFSTNILGVPETDEQFVDADAFTTLQPGAIFSYESPKLRAEMRYTLSARLFLRNSSANSFSNFLALIGSTDVSPLSQVGFGVNASAGRINAFETAPADTEVGQLPNGDLAYARIIGDQSFTHRFSELLGFRQNARAEGFTPTDETTTVNTNWNAGGTLALERNWKRHQGTISAEGRYVHNEVIDELGERQDPDKHIVAGPRVRWLWDISGTFSSSISAGLIRVFSPDDYNTGFYQPLASVQVSHLKERSLLTLRYVHDVATNSLVGQTSTIDRVSLRGDYPTTRLLEDSTISGTLAFQHAQFVNVQTESLERSANTGPLDLAGLWKQTDGLQWAVRYQYTKQNRDMPLLGQSQDFSRHQVQVIVTIRYPERQAVEIPKRRGERVDGADDESEEDEREGGGRL